MTVEYLRLDNIIEIELAVCERLRDAFARQMPRFTRTAHPKKAVPDVILRDLTADTARQTVSRFRGARYTFGYTHCEGTPALVMLGRAAPIAAIVAGAPPIVYIHPATAKIGPAYVLVLFAIQQALQRAGRLMLHGACLTRPNSDNAVLFVGARGTCKTCLSLTLMRDGWGYISDDKLIVTEDGVVPFEDVIGIRDWHVEKLSWLHNRLPRNCRCGKGVLRRRLRAAVGRCGAGLLAADLAVRWRDRWSGGIRVPVSELFPETPVPPRAHVQTVIHIKPSEHVALDIVDRMATMRTIVALERMLFLDLAPLPSLLQVYCEGGEPCLQEGDVQALLASPDCRELRLPTQGSFDQHERHVLTCLHQLS